MQNKIEGKFLKNLLGGDFCSRHINKTKLRRQKRFGNTSIKILKCDNFYIGVNKTIISRENLT